MEVEAIITVTIVVDVLDPTVLGGVVEDAVT